MTDILDKLTTQFPERMSARPNRTREFPSIWIILLLQVLLSGSLAYAIVPLFNTLLNNGRWQATKTTMGMRLMGSQEFVNGTQALSQDKLNLGVWHGHQEAIYVDKLNPQEIDFNFYLSTNSYLYCIFNKSDTKFSAIRLSTIGNFSSVYVTALDSGKFMSKNPLSCGLVQANKWKHIKISFADNSFSVYLNGKQIGEFPEAPMRDQRIGFRGGKNNSFVDDISIRGNGSTIVLQESFWNKRLFFRAVPLIFGASIVLDVLFLAMALFRKKQFHETRVQITILTFCVFILSFPLWTLTALKTSLYPKIDSWYNRVTPKKDYLWLMNGMKEVRENLRQKYVDNASGDRFRILFIGTSQTWGSGARTEQETYVRRVEDLLNERNHGKLRVECVNTGVQGANAPFLYKNYERDWIDLHPKIAVIDLSSNDVWGPGPFYNALKRFAALNRERGVKTIFVLEPNSSEHTSGELLTHEKMRLAGNEDNILTLDLHLYMKEREDDGILWWDNVHPTSYGHELIAEFLAKHVQNLIESK